MKFYWIKTHWLVKKLFSKYIWSIPVSSKTVYLTFDDGPTPEITEWVLSQLQQFNSKATFFCIGYNIAQNRGIFDKISASGHTIGNHTYNHMNGWHTDDETYLENVNACEKEITGNNKNLFRPPYGKLSRKQAKALLEKDYKIIMWDVLSADFDQTITKEKCLDNVIKNIRPGSIIIFHDSVKASENLKYALPKTLQYLAANGYKCEAIV
jgi:peptidoglycan/xylan/chitin deacetylase (PgdA/CDA1 family)